jgi:hypothetical protein
MHKMAKTLFENHLAHVHPGPFWAIKPGFGGGRFLQATLLQRAAAARRALFRLLAGADDELQNDELQTDLPAEVADRSSCRYQDRPRYFRNAWTYGFRARNARPTT